METANIYKRQLALEDSFTVELKQPEVLDKTALDDAAMLSADLEVPDFLIEEDMQNEFEAPEFEVESNLQTNAEKKKFRRKTCWDSLMILKK